MGINAKSSVTCLVLVVRNRLAAFDPARRPISKDIGYIKVVLAVTDYSTTDWTVRHKNS
jgi:hypothetical protein